MMGCGISCDCDFAQILQNVVVFYAAVLTSKDTPLCLWLIQEYFTLTEQVNRAESSPTVYIVVYQHEDYSGKVDVLQSQSCCVTCKLLMNHFTQPTDCS